MRAQAQRESVVDLCRELADRGFLAGTGGNVALRVDEHDFAVTPSATDYYAMTAQDVSVLRLRDLRQVEGARAPSVESSLHARVLRARPDCQWSVHTHQPVASACTLLGRPLDVHDPHLRALLGAKVAFAGYAPSGTAWLAGKLARVVQPGINAYLLRNHGVLCCAADARTAVRTLVALETVAARFLLERIRARAAGDSGRRTSLMELAAALARESGRGSAFEHDGEPGWA